MKVIHSFVSKEIIWKELAYTQMLSALLAQKHYGNIHFYTTEKHKEQIEAMGIGWDTPESLNTLQHLCFESFRSNYTDSFINQAKEIYND